ncbi:metacaspase-2-like isoform X2 [Aphidius gifuensis]|uniref:metacaspase-2-like isoform X2 n=1 Tax=Aphidius gifuensis TaxID=684658 RepID=UPI001CDD4C02|nr:metacaspase-2-like isoform X2 [Aphidius gifuensis]
MVYPTIPIESSSRSQLEIPPVHQISSPSQLHQQQQHILYPTFGTIPSVYSQGNIPFQNQCNQFDPRHHQATNIALRTTQELRAMQKNTKWQTKVRAPKVKEFLGIQNNIQQQYVQSPMMLYDSSHLTPSQSSLSPVYLSQSAYSQAPYLTEPFTQFTPTHQYYKPPEFQTFCLIPERQNSIGQYNQPIHQQSYYNVKSKFQLSTSTVCPTNNIDNEKYLPLSSSSSSSLINDNSKKIIQQNNHINYDIDKKNNNDKKCNNIKNLIDDESSNFNFTIEAEKMVSELCNTYDYDDKIQAKSLNIKQEIKNDNFYNEIPENKQDDIDNTKYSDLIKKLMYWACNEADMILKNSNLITTKETSLLNLLSATKIALEKSSTCLPLYSGDKIFYQDLINSLMRICNGWLLLDHYLNRQNLINEKYDKDMIDSFKLWETSSHNLIINLVKTFIKINKNCHDKIDDNCTISSSIPGDVSLYLNNGIFGNFTIGKTAQLSYQQIIKNPSRNIIYPSMQNYEQKYHWPPIVRDNKLKSKWTVTDSNTTNKINDSYSLKNILNNDIINQRQHNIIIPQVIESTTTTSSSSIDNSIPIFNNLNIDEKSGINVANRMTLLSKIENKKKDDTMEGETINLSALFASMRNNKNLETNTLYNNSWWQTNTNITTTKLHHHHHQNVEFKMDANKQIRTLKNMRTIQSAPWTANYIFNDGNSKNNDNDNLQIYMKPGSYNVPKKNYHLNNSKNDLSKNIYLPVDQSIQLKSNDEISCLPTVKTSQSLNNLSEKINVSFTAGSSLTNPNDIAWKAACASAEYILGSLSVNETTTNTKKIDDKTTDNDGKIDNYFTSQWQYKNFNKTDGEVSSYEASDDDSDDFELSNNKNSNDDTQKSHFKTDSWLIKTLNASTIINNNNINDKIVDDVDKKINDDKAISSDKTFDNNGKVTYSETVRKIPSNTKLSAAKKISTECIDESYQSMSSFTSLDDSKIVKINESSTPKIINDKACKVKKNNKNYQNCDKGWSVWYTSKKKQNTLTIEGFVIEKLTNIHKTLWKLDSSKIFKYPSSNLKLTNGYSKIDHYRKIIKNPIFLDTIGYKLKNNVYRKMEHVIKDFRKVVNNSKIYYKNNKDVIEKIESMSRKLEELINQHFSDTNRVSNNNEEINKSSSKQLTNCVNNNPTIVDEKKILTSNNRPSKSINCSKSQLTNVT